MNWSIVFLLLFAVHLFIMFAIAGFCMGYHWLKTVKPYRFQTRTNVKVMVVAGLFFLVCGFFWFISLPVFVGFFMAKLDSETDQDKPQSSKSGPSLDDWLTLGLMMEPIADDCLCTDIPGPENSDPNQKDYANPSCHSQYCPHYLYAYIVAKSTGAELPE